MTRSSAFRAGLRAGAHVLVQLQTQQPGPTVLFGDACACGTIISVGGSPLPVGGRLRASQLWVEGVCAAQPG